MCSRKLEWKEKKKTNKNVVEIIHKEINVTKSSKLKAVLCGYDRHFLERYRSSKFMIFSKKYFIRQSLSLCIFRTRTPKHKNLALFCMIAEGNIFRKLRQLQMKTYHFLSRIISLSGDVESNPGPANEYCKSVPFISPTNSVCLLEFRLSQLGRTALDVGGGGDCFFRAVHINSMEILIVIPMYAVLAFSIE